MRIITRRSLLALLIASAAVHAEDSVSVVWRVPGDRVGLARDAVHFSDGQISADESSIADSKGLPLLYVLAGVVLLPELAKGLVSVYKEWTSLTTVVDSSGGKLVITHDPRGSADVTIVKGANGQVTIYDNRKSFSSEKWLQILVAAVAKK